MTTDDKKQGPDAQTDGDIDGIDIVDNVSDIGTEDDLAALDELAQGMADDDEIDMDGGEDFSFDVAEEKQRRGGGLKKVMAPVLVLVTAASVGGYIIMNPDIISKLMNGGSTNAVNYAAAPAAIDPDLAPHDTASAFPPPVDVGAMPPMPEADTTELAASYEPIMSPDMPSMDEVPRSPFVDESVADVAPADTWQAPEEEAVESVVAMTPPEVTAPEIAAADVPAIAPAANEIVAAPPALSAPDEQEYGSADDPQVVQTVSPSEAVMPEMPPVSSVVTPQAPPAPTPAPTPQATPQGGMAAAVPPAAAGRAGADAYYDGGVNLPSGPMAKDAMRVVDPSVEPAQKLVIARQDHSQSSQEALIEAASRALKLQRYDAALEMYEQLYARNKRDHRILMGLAIAQQYSGRPESAIQTYEALLDLNPRNADALVNMLGLLRQQYPEVALRRLLDLQDKFPNNAGIAAQIGVTQADLGHFDDAVRYMQIASSLEPRNAQHLFNIAVIADRKGAVHDAIRYYEQALETDAVHGGGRSVPRESIYDRLSKLRQR